MCCENGVRGRDGALLPFLAGLAITFVCGAGSLSAWATCPIVKLAACEWSDEYSYGVIAVDGDLALVGAPLDGMNGPATGSASVYRFDGAAWELEARLFPSDPVEGDEFGYAVAVHGDLAVVGAWRKDAPDESTGAAYVFEYDGSAWIQQQKLTPADPDVDGFFGYSVDVSADCIAVGARGQEWTGAVYIFRLDGAQWVQESKLNASDAVGGEWFGCAVALAGEALVIGAEKHDGLGVRAGAAYIFRFDTGSDQWVEEARLLASDGEAEALFGDCVAMRDDLVLIGAPRATAGGPSAGAAYVFEYDGASWTETAQLLASDRELDDNFGTAVALGADTALVGAIFDDDQAEDAGSLYLFHYDGSMWGEETKLLSPDAETYDRFGRDIGLEGAQAFGGSKGGEGGAVYVLTWSEFPGEDCNVNGVPDSCDIRFSTSEDCNINEVPDECDINDGTSDDCNGNARPDECDISDGTSPDDNGNDRPDECDGWCEIAEFYAGAEALDDDFGVAVALRDDVAAVGAHLDDDNGEDAGAVLSYRYDPFTMAWSEEAVLLASDGMPGDRFGCSIAMSGDVIAIGAQEADLPGAADVGAVYVFRYAGGVWVEEAKITAGDADDDDRFGYSVAIEGDVLIVGAPRDDNTAGDNAGAVYVLRLEGEEWTEQVKLTDPDGEDGDQFGYSVALSGDVLLVGVIFDKESGYDAGAVIAYRDTGSTWEKESTLLASDGGSDHRFGVSVALDGDIAVVGATGHDGGAQEAGAAYIFRSAADTTEWVEEARLEPSEPQSGSEFGRAVAVENGCALVGAYHYWAAARRSGAAFVYRHDGASWVETTMLVSQHSGAFEHFGWALTLDGGRVLVGAPGDGEPGGHPESAWIFAGLHGFDCNENGVSDACDIFSGTSDDLNANGVPDECECLADITGDGIVNEEDLERLLQDWGGPGDADINYDGIVNVRDLLALLAAWGECP
jgi:hypothetical protein